MIRDEYGRPRTMFKNLRKLHGQNIDGVGLNNLTEAFSTFMTRARFFSIGHLRRTWSHSAVEFMKYRRRLPALMASDGYGDGGEYGMDGRDFDTVSITEGFGGGCGFGIGLGQDLSEADEPGSSGSSMAFNRASSQSFREQKTSESESRKIYVSNVSYRATTSQLASFFTKFGKVTNCTIPLDKMGTFPRGGKPRSKGIAYITFKYEEGLEAAKNARPEELKFYDRIMVVSQGLPTPRKRPKSELQPPSSQATIAIQEDDPSCGASASETEPESTPTSPMYTQTASISNLPDNVFVKVFGTLDLKDRVRIERVCKRWLELAYLSWSHQRSLKFSSHQYSASGGRKPLQNSTLNAILHRCGRYIQSIDLSGTPHFLDSSSLKLVATHCPNLVSVDLTGLKVDWEALKVFAESCPNLTAIAFRDAHTLGEKAFWYLFRNCKNLEKVDLSGCKRLQGRCFRLLGLFLNEVNLDGCINLECEAMEELTLKCPNISILSLNHCFRMNDQSISLITRSFSSLKEISLCGGAFSEISSSGLAQLGLVELLEKVYLDNNKAVSDEVIEGISGGCPMIKEFSLSGAGTEDSLTEVGLSNLSACQFLTHVNLSYLAGVKDSVLVLGLSKIGSLKVVKLRGCLNIGDKGVTAVARSCAKIEELDLSGCLRVSNVSIQNLIAKHPNSTKISKTVSVVIGGTVCQQRTLATDGSRVVLDTSDYSKAYLVPGMKNSLTEGSLSQSLYEMSPGASTSMLRDEEDAANSDNDIEDDEFESLTASRSFVLETLEEDDFVIDEKKLLEWQQEFGFK